MPPPRVLPTGLLRRLRVGLTAPFPTDPERPAIPNRIIAEITSPAVKNIRVYAGKHRIQSVT
jgi:hypothetical protein